MYWTQESFLDKNPLNFLIEWITSKTYRTSFGVIGGPQFLESGRGSYGMRGGGANVNIMAREIERGSNFFHRGFFLFKLALAFLDFAWLECQKVSLHGYYSFDWSFVA